MFPLAEEYRCYRQVHFVDTSCDQILTNYGHAAADSHFLALRRLFRFLQSRLQSISDEVERGTAFHREGRPRVMREHKHGRMVRRIVAPPPFPGIVFPRTPNRPEHIPAQDPGADILERQSGKIVVDARSPAALTVHLLKYLGVKKPVVELSPADSERILQVLPGPSPKPIDRNRKRTDFNVAHRNPSARLQFCFNSFRSIQFPQKGKGTLISERGLYLTRQTTGKTFVAIRESRA
jgi:hypothetical protein